MITKTKRCMAMTSTPFLMILQCEKPEDHIPPCMHEAHWFTHEGRFDLEWHVSHD
jgi:hypothetical protein